MAEQHPVGPICIICHRREDDPLHQADFELGGIANETAQPRFPQHAYDPGERRRTIRRAADRQTAAWAKAQAEHDAEAWNREHYEGGTVSEQKFRIVTRPGQDMLHRYPAFEECNLDDAEAIRPVTEREGWGMVEGGQAAACAYCFPLPSEVADVSEPG